MGGYKEKPIEKRYYKIAEVAEMFNLATSNLRYWESEFSQLRPKKNFRGERRYMKKDVEVVKKIYFLLKTRRFTIEGAKMVLEKEKNGKKEDFDPLIDY